MLPRGAQLLDYGCGTGDISFALGDFGYRVLGVDRASKMIEAAQIRSQRQDVRFERVRCSDDEVASQFGRNRFDGVVLSSVLEYVQVPAVLLRQLNEVCRDGAWLFATAPNTRHPCRWAEALVARVDRRIHPDGSRLSPYREYLRVSTTRYGLMKWCSVLRESGWHVEQIVGRYAALSMLIAKRLGGVPGSCYGQFSK
ncbi:MAG: methyltransferase domain-containing protein [Bryobacterales bacterium]|nr:methyltransferase domain-containing protein [Bryobacterales bacterium]